MRFALIRDKNRINPSSPPLPSSTYSLLPFHRNPHFGWGPYKGLGPWHALILVCIMCTLFYAFLYCTWTPLQYRYLCLSLSVYFYVLHVHGPTIIVCILCTYILLQLSYIHTLQASSFANIWATHHDTIFSRIFYLDAIYVLAACGYLISWFNWVWREGGIFELVVCKNNMTH